MLSNISLEWTGHRLFSAAQPRLLACHSGAALDLLASSSASLQPPDRQTVQLDMTHHLSSVRASDTKPEWILRGGLHRLGFRYRLHRKDLPGKPGLVFLKYRSVVFVHGCFWHRHIKCKDTSMPSANQEFWMNKLIATIRRDSRVLQELHDLEWKTMMVWECQLEKDTIAAINRVTNWLSQEKTAPNISFGTGSPRVNRKELIRASVEKVRSRAEAIVRMYWLQALAASSKLIT